MQLGRFSGLAKDWPTFKSCFKFIVYDNCGSDEEASVHLSTLLPSEVKESLGATLLQPHMFAYAMRELEKKYGSPQMVSMDCIGRMLGLPPLKEDDLPALKHFSSTVRGAVATLASTGHSAQLACHSTLLQLLNKLTPLLRREWGRQSYAIESATRLPPSLADFDHWLDTIYMEEQRAQPFVTNTGRHKSNGPHRPGSTHSLAEAKKLAREGAAKYRRSCHTCGADHRLDACARFKALHVEKRADLVRKKRICWRCLDNGDGHATKECPRPKKKCTGETDCKFFHHPLLHGASFAPRPAPTAHPVTSVKTLTTPAVVPPVIVPVTLATSENSECDLYGALPIVPVVVKANGIELTTYALLDQGSQVSLIHQSLAAQLDLKGPKRKTLTGTFHGSDPIIVTRRVNFQLLSADGISCFRVNQAEAVPNLNISRPAIDWSTVKRDWPHLKDVTTPDDFTAADVKVLIGVKVSDAHDVIDDRKAPPHIKNAPRGVLTPFGWVIIGGINIDHPTTSQINFINDLALPLDGLPERFDRWCHGESWGTDPHVKRPIPHDDQRAQTMLEGLLKNENNVWQTGLLWRMHPPQLHDNYEVALRRVKSLERRFESDLEYAANYSQIVEGYCSRAFSRLTTQEELDNTPPGCVNYLPHHGVLYPNKPGKIRVVFDASVKYRGTSLNDRLYRGIDYLNSLTAVLLRFRRHHHAVSLDIEKMFHMVKVNECDQAALRYLWKPLGSTGPPQVYQMTVMPFGLVCSPSVCFYLIRRTASDHEADFPGLTAIVQHAFYADNYLDSFDDRKAAIDCCIKLRSMLQRGGFNLNQLVSTDRGVLAAFPGEVRANPSVDLDLDELPTDRALGQRWDCDKDAFILEASVKDKATTRRQLMSVVASIFDPLGFLAPVTVVGKLLLQETHKDKATWDQQLNQDLLTRWDKWTDSLSHLVGIAIPRCLKPSSDKPVSTQIHGFSDASMVAFAAVVYLRYEFENGHVHVAFVCARSKIAPMTDGLLIHRLELDAALLLYRLVKQVKSDLTADGRMTINDQRYWSDNTTVLRQIYSRNCRFETYQANRLGTILEKEGPGSKAWRYVPTTENPADDCCRGIDASTLSTSHRWWTGPDFLRLAPVNWPSFPGNVPLELDASSPGVRSIGWAGAIIESNGIEQLIERSSSILSLCRTVAWIHRFIQRCRAKKPISAVATTVSPSLTDHLPSTNEPQDEPLSVAEIRSGRLTLILTAQKAVFLEEIRDIQEGRSIRNTSRLLPASPFIDRQGLLRVGGRLQHAELPYDARHPVILPRDHRVTRLIARRVHVELGHASAARTLSSLTDSYYIMAPRSLLKSIIHECSFCVRKRAKPSVPRMADLPWYRAQSSLPLFHHTGVDMFGPIEVIIFRRRVKRYGFLFTCLCTRAVNLQVGHSADLDSFFMAFCRFAKGPRRPAHMYIDNGGNFIATSKAILEAFKRWCKRQLVDTLSAKGVQWHFNPPAGQHMGGAWERLIQSAKSALAGVLNGLTLTDEVLMTAFAEVEEILNNRPLTYLSVDPTDLQPITPNDLLFNRPGPYTPFDVEDESDINSRQRVKQAQAIATMFNRRWRKEYFPHLLERRKWLLPRRNIQVGDLVLIVVDNADRHEWPRGRVVETRTAADGVVRSALIRTATGQYIRPVAKLCLLEEQFVEEPSDVLPLDASPLDAQSSDAQQVSVATQVATTDAGQQQPAAI